MKAAIIGEKNMVLAFYDLGMAVFGIDKEEDFLKAKEEIDNKDFAVVFITEIIAEKYNIDDLLNRTLPAVLVVPGANGSSGKGTEGLKKSLQRALGSELEM